jgi:hypothetical protein
MENELSRVVDTLPGLVWRALPDGHVDFFNQRRCGVAKSCVRGCQTAIHPEDLPELLERWRSILASCGPGEMEAGPSALPGRVRKAGLNRTTREETPSRQRSGLTTSGVACSSRARGRGRFLRD